MFASDNEGKSFYILVVSPWEIIGKHSTNYLKFCFKMIIIIQGQWHDVVCMGGESHGHYIQVDILIDTTTMTWIGMTPSNVFCSI